MEEDLEEDLLADVFPDTEDATLPYRPHPLYPFLVPTDDGPFAPIEKRTPNHNEDRG